MLIIDGSHGEGGGQILRSALALSMVTGEPFRIEKIRANRAKPGLMRQHLTCVKAAVAVASARTDGAELGSRALTFHPGDIKGGDYTFDIGSAGSTMLVLQTILPALAARGEGAAITLRGGTHNSGAPPFDFLARVFLPQLARMGVMVTMELVRPGYVPAGGGEVVVRLAPGAKLQPIEIVERGALVRRSIMAVVNNLAGDIAEREVAAALAVLDWPPETASRRSERKADGPGNIVSIVIEHEALTEVFTGFGRRGVGAEDVARETAEAAKAYLASDAPVGEHLADQLLLPLALARGGRYVTTAPTEHTTTNIAVIEKFLPVEITVTALDAARHEVRIT